MKDKRLKAEYAEALLIYATTVEPLKSITDRLGLRYNTVVNYIRYNYPHIVSQHKSLLPKDEEVFAEGVAQLCRGGLSPRQVKEQLGYGQRFLHYVRKNFPELCRRRWDDSHTKSRPGKVAKYAEAVAMLTEMKRQQHNVLRKVAEEVGLNYDSLRMYVYAYHRELIGLDPAKNKSRSNPRSAAKYAVAIARLAAEPKRPQNIIRHVAEELGLSYHALRWYIYNHHPELSQRRRTRHKQ